MRRVVVTGMGVYSCIGKNKVQVTESLLKGKCGLVKDNSRLEHGFCSPLTGFLDSPDVPFPAKRYMSQETEYLYSAVKEAIQDAGEIGKCGIIIGNDSNSLSMARALDELKRYEKNSRLGSSHVIRTMNSNCTAVISNLFGIKGISFTIGGACASGGHAVGTAYCMICQGLEDTIICGGCQELNEVAVFAFDALRNFSLSEDPKEAVRPFDSTRNGLVPSGGAACLVLEELEHAKSRGAKIYAEIVGYGATSSGELITSNMSSQALCMKKALGSISPNEVNFISAHATGTVSGDKSEAKAIKEVFRNSPYISATKALTGHEMWMAGASEIIYALLSLKNGFVPPNINTEDNSMNLNIHHDLVRLNNWKYMLSNSFGLGGTNSSILISNYETVYYEGENSTGDMLIRISY